MTEQIEKIIITEILRSDSDRTPNLDPWKEGTLIVRQIVTKLAEVILILFIDLDFYIYKFMP